MGYTGGLYKAKNHRYVDGKTLSALSNYLFFLRNDFKWEDRDGNPISFTKDFDGYKKYCELVKLNYYNCVPCFDNLVDYYQVNNRQVFEEIDTYGSGAIVFDKWLRKESGFVNLEGHLYGAEFEAPEVDIELSKKDIFKCLKWCEEYLDSKEFKLVVTANAFRDDTDGDGIECVKLIPCDGIEYQDEEGHLYRSYSSFWEMSDIYICESCYNDWEVNTIRRLKNTFIDILENVDFDENVIFYKGG